MLASSLLMLLIRAPVRRLVGPRIGYALWLLPALVAGPQGAAGGGMMAGAQMLFWLWLAGAAVLVAVYTLRHLCFCQRLRAN